MAMQAENVEYLAKHGVGNALDAAVLALVEEKPDDVGKWFAAHFTKLAANPPAAGDAKPAEGDAPKADAPAIKYYWGSLSQPSRAIKGWFDDSGIAYEAVHVDMLKGEHKSEAITAINPAGTLPFVTVDGKLYKETVAVLRYLCNKFPSNAKAYPDDLEKRFAIDQACDFYTDAFRPAFIKEIVVRFGAMGEKRELTDTDKKAIEVARTSQDKVIKALEGMVEASEGKFVCGDSLTLADYILFAELQDVKYLTPEKVDEYAKAKQYEADVMEASAGLKEIHRADGDWATQVLPAAQGMFGAK